VKLWNSLKSGITTAAQETIPPVSRVAYNTWFTEEVSVLVVEKAKKFDAYRDAMQNPRMSPAQRSEKYAAYKMARSAAKTACHNAREAEWAAEAAANVADMKKGRWSLVHRRMRNFVRSKKKVVSENLQDANGNVLVAPADKLNRWREYFGSLLHSRDPENDCKVDLSMIPPGREEYKTPPDDPPPKLADVKRVLKRLKSRRAAGPDGISAELLKYGGPTFVRRFHELIAEVWRTEKAPQDWKDAIIVTLYKKKDPSLCDNYRGLSLLSIPGKAYALLLLDLLKGQMEKVLMECQSGFREGRSTMDQMFTLQQVLHDSWEFDVPTHSCFIDLKKAYDSVNRPALWGVLEQIGLSGKVKRLIRDLHTGTRSSVRAYGATSESFEVNKGVRQGCILAPALFNIFLDHVLRIALAGSDGGVTIQYAIDGNLPINKRVTSPDEIKETVLALLYADDMAIVCDDASALARIVRRLDSVLYEWGLVISQEKTELLSIDRHNRSEPPAIELRGQPIKSVDNFKYLGSIYTDKPTGKKNKRSFLNTNLEHRIKKASGAFYRLAAPLYKRKDIPLRYKVQMYGTTALSVLLYGAEIWAPSVYELRRLEAWQNRSMRYMLGITYESHGNVPSKSLRQKCRLPKVEDRLRRMRLRWLGHCARMPRDRLPRKMVTSHLADKRPHGGVMQTWRKTIAGDLHTIGCHDNYAEAARNRKRWRQRSSRPQNAKPNRPRASTRLALRSRR
jgi:sorting nexin-29